MRTDAILLVDDNPDDVYLTIHAFRQNNIPNEIIVARDGVEALDLLLPAGATVGLNPAIVLLDINMPRMGGLEVLAHLRSDPRTRTLPVIMLTTSTNDHDIAESYGSGANSYVAKPVTSDEFLDAARTLGIYWLGLNIQLGDAKLNRTGADSSDADESGDPLRPGNEQYAQQTSSQRRIL